MGPSAKLTIPPEQTDIPKPLAVDDSQIKSYIKTLRLTSEQLPVWTQEIILKKPEVFKMACVRDINSLFSYQFLVALGEDIDDERTPFYAGFGNRITDAISYVKIPSHRIFTTINPNGRGAWSCWSWSATSRVIFTYW
ncbi:hypothetical protein JCM33374_g3694 [Metschnikowia sp. JCM 33374]|nr:hypothetical protein JCM33374_g3694 [Metschnikowia sp. JCM 33374]